MSFRRRVCYVACCARIQGVPAKFFISPLWQRGCHAAILRAALGAQHGKPDCCQFSKLCWSYADVGAAWGLTQWFVGVHSGRYGIVTRLGQES